MKCPNHPEKDVLSFCHSCGEYLCRECLVDGKEYYYCKKDECQKDLLNEVQTGNCEKDVINRSSNNHAGFWRRFAAFLIDYLILNIFCTIILTILWFIRGETNDSDYFDKILLVVIFWLYFSLMESSKIQGTLGKLILRIKVTDLNGERIEFGKATGRHFSRILSGFVLGIGFLMAAFTKQKQALHDILAGSLVVKRNNIHEDINRQSATTT